MCNNCGNNNCCCNNGYQIVGPQGPLGLTGPQGATGPQGPIGPIGPQGSPGVIAETLTVPMLAPQILNVAGAAYPDFAFPILTPVPGYSLVLSSTRLRAVGFNVGVFVNQPGVTVTFDLFNLTDAVVLAPPVSTTSLVEVPLGSAVAGNFTNLGDTIIVRMSIVGPPGSAATVVVGGIGEGDSVLNSTTIGTTTVFSPASTGYVKTAQIGILRGLSSSTFSTSVTSNFNNTVNFNNFSGLTLTQANSNTTPTLATAAVVRSNIALTPTTQSPLVGNRTMYFVSSEVYTLNI